jgi:Leucine-rich repeat (LRR) protein
VGLLIGRSLIEVVQTGYDSTSCKVHDVMRDLALHIIEGQKLITCLYRPGKKLVEFPGDWIRTYESQPCEVRKLSLMENDLTTLNGVTFSAPKLQVLLLAGNGRLEAMPKQFLKGIENLKVLDLGGCDKLKSLPKEIGNLRQLTHLDLGRCLSLESLPKEIGKLTHLTHLDLVRCLSLESLPKEIGKLTHLTHLDLVRCLSLESLPKEIGKLTHLTHLHLQGCWRLESLPKEIGKLTQLTHLDLSFCHHLKQLPKSIGYLQSLQWLDLRMERNRSGLKYLPSTMGDLRSLQYLSLDGSSSNGLWGKPSWKLYGQALAVDICKFTVLTEFHISGVTCEIVQLCDQLSKLAKLKSFHIQHSDKLKTLPDAIQSMVCPEFWVCYCGRMKILPSVVTLFSKLKVLKLEGMYSLKSLPTLNTLKMLSTLSIQRCESIKKLPDSFTSSDAFPSLKELDCFGSGLSEFSEVEDGAMPNLQILNLDATNIKSLPDSLIYLKNLKIVYICKREFDNFCKKFENSWLLGKLHTF